MTQTERPSPNHELFVQVLAQIEKHPETWKQAMWATRTDCGTSFCFAGHACQLSGVEINWAQPIAPGFSDFATTLDGRIIPDAAAFVLGMDVETAAMLFHAHNTLNDLYRISADILGLDEQVLREKVAAEIANGQVQQ